MNSTTHTITVRLAGDGDLEQSVAAITRGLGRAKLERPDPQTLTGTTGSRLLYRLLGTWSGSGTLPLRFRVTLAPGPVGTDVVVELTSDQGPYLIYTALHESVYRARFAEVTAQLEAVGFRVVPAS